MVMLAVLIMKRFWTGVGTTLSSSEATFLLMKSERLFADPGAPTVVYRFAAPRVGVDQQGPITLSGQKYAKGVRDKALSGAALSSPDGPLVWHGSPAPRRLFKNGFSPDGASTLRGATI
jgi:hypothetical protein